MNRLFAITVFDVATGGDREPRARRMRIRRPSARTAFVASIIAAVALLAMQPGARTAHAATYVVTTTADSGPGSLRQAILDANASVGTTDTITFGAGAITGPIQPLTPLPSIDDPAIIDGTSAPGYAGAPLVEIDGVNGLSGSAGISVSTSDSAVKGLSIFDGFAAGIEIAVGGNNVVEGNYLGLDTAGAAGATAQYAGVLVVSANNTIGGPLASQRNIISGNAYGVKDEFCAPESCTGGAPHANLVQGNYVGTDPSGTSARPNSTVGIAPARAGTTILGNLISGNAVGIDSRVGPDAIQGNYIGTDKTGTSAIPNARGIQLFGDDHVVGGATALERNVISGNGDAGILIGGGDSNTIEGNYIGLDTTGTARLGNSGTGSIYITGSSNIVADNVISAVLGNYGVYIANGSNNTIQENLIGTNAAGTAALGSMTGGVRIDGSNNLLGGLLASQRNVIATVDGDGVRINGASNTVEGNYIGLDATGTTPLGNYFGIDVSGANNVIGGSAPGSRNVISATGLQPAVQLGVGSDGSAVQGNYIGTAADGTTPMANSAWAIRVYAQNTLIGGAGAAANVIANSLYGVVVDGFYGTTNGNRIQRNSIYNNSYDGITLIRGANGSIAAPSIYGLTPVTGTACANCTIDVFTDTANQGQYYEGTVTADAAGRWTYSGPLTGTNVTATATDGANNTSQFSTTTSAVTSALYCPGSCYPGGGASDLLAITGFAAGVPASSSFSVSERWDTSCAPTTALAGAAVYEPSIATTSDRYGELSGAEGITGLSSPAGAAVVGKYVSEHLTFPDSHTTDSTCAVVQLDTDSDGIADSVDPSPAVSSNAFSDGTTFGTITARNGCYVSVVDATVPGDGLVIGNVCPPTGGGPATFSVCGFTGKLTIPDGGAIVGSCDSFRSGTISGTAIFEFGPTGNDSEYVLRQGPGSRSIVADLGDNASYSVVADPANVSTIDVIFLGHVVTMPKGTNIVVVSQPDGSSQLTNSTQLSGQAPILVDGQSLAQNQQRTLPANADGDGCADAKEALLVPPTSASDPWDFYAVPVPALFAAPDPLLVFKDANVSAADAQAIFAYFKKSAHTGTLEYEQDLNNNGIKDGVEYDRSVVGPGQSGPPNGTVAASDAQLAFAQFKKGYHC